MRRKLLVLAGLIGICGFGMLSRPALAAYPVCSDACTPGTLCQCPWGSPNHGIASCDTWYADCHYL